MFPQFRLLCANDQVDPVGFRRDDRADMIGVVEIKPRIIMHFFQRYTGQ